MMPTGTHLGAPGTPGAPYDASPTQTGSVRRLRFLTNRHRAPSTNRALLSGPRPVRHNHRRMKMAGGLIGMFVFGGTGFWR